MLPLMIYLAEARAPQRGWNQPPSTNGSPRHSFSTAPQLLAGFVIVVIMG